MAAQPASTRRPVTVSSADMSEERNPRASTAATTSEFICFFDKSPPFLGHTVHGVSVDCQDGGVEGLRGIWAGAESGRCYNLRHSSGLFIEESLCRNQVG